MRLDWKKIRNVSTTAATLEKRVAALQKEYQDIFSETLGIIMLFQAKLSVKPEDEPKFFKARSVPYALREQVKSKLDRLERDGVLEKMSHSEWAAPVVAVPKSDGCLCLRRDY